MARLSLASQRVAKRLFQRLPAFEAHARMEAQDGSGEFDLLVEVPSPSSIADRKIYLWMEGGTEPSLGFGGWHTHRGLESVTGSRLEGADAIIDLIEGILADRFVLVCGAGPLGEWFDLIDSRDPDALLDELTAPLSPGRVRILTWSGKGDRVATLQDPESI